MATSVDEKMAALLAEVQKILEPMKGKDAAAAKVAKEVDRMIKEDELRGFKVIRKFRARFTPGQRLS